MDNGIYSISEIKDIVCPVARKYGVRSVFLFGSYAKGTASASSDIDLRIDKGDVKGMFALSALRIELLELLEKNIDLLTTGSLDDSFLNSIKSEEIKIYG